ncbi:MAG TPA: RNA polymerase sigma factor SigZ [Nitrospira sp.]|nr:RNA polymerase sigma factor SigZ [Nitrospira sp.]
MGDTAAEVWQQVHDGLRAFIGKRVTNETEIDDILQEVFVRVHQHLEQLKDPDRLVSWMFQITRHVIIDYYRSPERRREVPVGLTTDLEEHDAEASSVSDSDDKMELSGCLRPMLERLTSEYREAIRLVELEGLTHQQAAIQLGLSVPGMKSRVQRGRQQLRKLLDDCCLIELDRRRGVAGYERRPDGQC